MGPTGLLLDEDGKERVMWHGAWGTQEKEVSVREALKWSEG